MARNNKKTVSYQLLGDVFRIEGYNQARPFSSFLPGIAGEFGKPMWVFTTNRGQCIASFGIRNKNNAMLEFYPANKAYQTAPLMGFRTFLSARVGGKTQVYEPFAVNNKARQTLDVRASEIEIREQTPWGIDIVVSYWTVPHDAAPLLVREVKLENKSRKSIRLRVVDGLPQIVPFGLNEFLLKQMSRTMEAFAEIRHAEDRLPFYKLKTEPTDKPEVIWIDGGFFSFTLRDGVSIPIAVDPESVFGQDTSFQSPRALLEDKDPLKSTQRYETTTGAAFSVQDLNMGAGKSQVFHSFYGQAGNWKLAEELRSRVKTKGYALRKREENRSLINELTDAIALRSGVPGLDAYSRQAYLDNSLRGGKPYLVDRPNSAPQVFHYYSRKHGDMERDYNFFELAPSYLSQGNGNFRDVNQNRRSELFFEPTIGSANVQTFFDLLQLDGFNPLVIQYEKFYVEEKNLASLQENVPGRYRADLEKLIQKPFEPGQLLEQLEGWSKTRDQALERFRAIMSQAQKIQGAAHGEGYWVDHWTYNLDLLENYLAVYPDEAKSLLVERREFTYFESDHTVQPRSKKYVLRADGKVRQLNAVVVDKEKAAQIKARPVDPNKVRTGYGTGSIYKTSLLVKLLNLIGAKAASLDPFGVGLEMESDKPGWCDALNGLPALFGSSVNESFELLRLVRFVRAQLPVVIEVSGVHAVPQELVEFLMTVADALELAREDDFFKTWDTLASLRERFRETTRLGIDGQELPMTFSQIDLFLERVQQTLEAGVQRAFGKNGLCATYFINEITRCEPIPSSEAEPRVQTVKALGFKQKALAPFLEGPVHALRVTESPHKARSLYKAVRQSPLYDEKLGMYRLNVSVEKESFEIGRNKVFTPGWLENESIFLHMHYKFLLGLLRSGLCEEFYENWKKGAVLFQKPEIYGRSTLENSSFIVSSRFPDPDLHGAGFVARLSGATAEWISMLYTMAFGADPFRWTNSQLRFSPRPLLASWLFDGDTFEIKLFTKTTVVYKNPSRRNTFGPGAPQPSLFELHYFDGRKAVIHEGNSLPDPLARDLRACRLARLIITLS